MSLNYYCNSSVFCTIAEPLHLGHQPLGQLQVHEVSLYIYILNVAGTMYGVLINGDTHPSPPLPPPCEFETLAGELHVDTTIM